MAAELEFDINFQDVEEQPVNTLKQSRAWYEKLPDLLRILGASVLLVTMYSFLVDGWQSGNDSLRYLMMLAHTSLMALIGLASLKWLNEAKGARLLISLALVSIPANFAILGALIYSCVGHGADMLYPDYVAWHASSLLSASGLAVSAMALLAPLTWLGFRVLARSMSRELTLLFLANNSLLLLPFRDGDIVGGILVAALALTVVVAQRVTRGNVAAKTPNGALAALLPYLPLVILAGRGLWLYSSGLFLVVVLTIGGFFLLRQIQTCLVDHSSALLRHSVELLSGLSALVTIPPLAVLLHGSAIGNAVLALPVAALVSAWMFLDLAQRASSASLYRRLAAVILTLAFGVNLWVHDGVMVATAAVVTGLALTAYACQQKQRSMLLTGVLLILAGMAHQIIGLVIHFDLGSWVGLAVLGTMAIVLASILESRGGRLVKVAVAHWQNVASWDA